MIKLSKALVILTFISMFWLPKASFVSVTGLRPEDFSGFICLLFLPVFYVNTYKKISQKFLLSLIIYFLYILCISLIRSFEYFPYILILFFKELSYLSTFFIFFYTFDRLFIPKAKSFLKTLFIIIIPPLVYGMYQLLTFNFSGIYGLSLYGHEQSPASNGLLFLFIFIFLMISSKSVANIKISKPIIIISGLLILLTGSKIAVLGMFAFIMSSYLLGSKIQEKIYAIAGISLGLMVMSYLIISNIGALHRYTGFLNPLKVIQNRGIWHKVEWVDGIVGNITGMGLEAGHVNNGKFSLGMAMDNLYLYWYIVLGLLGTLFFLAVLVNLIFAFPKNRIERKFFISILITFLGMGMGAEVFQLSISGLLFWSMSGTLLALSRNNKWIMMDIFKR